MIIYYVNNFIKYKNYVKSVSLKCGNNNSIHQEQVQEFKKYLSDIGVPYKIADKYFSYHLDRDGYSYDITSYRKELKYKNNKPTKLEYARTLKEDLERRDFTINTLAIDSGGKLVDILNSKSDLNSKTIKVVGDTEKRLTEDKTRIIRAIRLCCTLDFNLNMEIMSFLSKHGSYLKDIPREYIKKELDKIFDEGGYNKFYSLVTYFKLEDYLNINNFDLKDDNGEKGNLEITLDAINSSLDNSIMANDKLKGQIAYDVKDSEKYYLYYQDSLIDDNIKFIINKSDITE